VEALPSLVRVWKCLEKEATATKDLHTKNNVHKQEEILTLMRTCSVLFKQQQRDTQHDTIRSGIVPLLARTAERLQNETANDDENNSKRTSATTSSDEDEKKCEDMPVIIPEPTVLFNNSSLLEELLLLVKQLNHRAEPDDQRFLYDHLLSVILGCCACDPKSSTIAVAETVTSVLWNWSTCAPLCRIMCANAAVWNSLCRLWQMNECISDTVLRNISATAGTMITFATTAPQQNNPNGGDSADQSLATIRQQSWLVPALLQALETVNVDTDYRRRCMRTIRCFACSEWGQRFLWEHRTKLETALLEVLRMEQEIGHDTRTMACETVSALLPTMMQHYHDQSPTNILVGPFIEMALISVVETASDSSDLGPVDKLVWSAIQALCTSLKLSPWQRSADCFSENFFEEIMVVLQEKIDQPSMHVAVSNLLLQLVKRDETISIDDDTTTASQIRDITTLLASTAPVREILTMLLSPIAHPDLDVSRRNAVNVIQALIDDSDCNKKPLADDEYILTALVNVCLMNNNQGSPIKEAAKQLILSLVPEL